MESSLRRRFTIFSLVFILIGISGVNISGAATKFTAPSAPLQVRAVGGISKATVTWLAPKGTGGVPITSYTVTYYPWKKSYVCKALVLKCIVPVVNPNKPSAKPTAGIFYFTVYATNSIGSSSESERSPTVSVTFPGTVYVAPKTGPATPTPSSTPTIYPTTTPIPCGQQTGLPITTFDGSYHGQAIVTATQNVSPPVSATTTIATNFAILNGRGTGSADVWDVNGCVTDATGGGTVVASNNLYGAITFAIKLSIDSATHVLSGTGKGTNTFSVPGMGSITVEFVLNVTTNTNQ